jgi:chromosome segregation ATPase
MQDKLAEAGTGLGGLGAPVVAAPPATNLPPEVQAVITAAAAEVAQYKAQVQTFRAQVEKLETELTVQKREQAIALNELAQANTRITAANQVVKEHEDGMTKLLAENRSLIEEREHLRTILASKDQMIAEAKEAPQTLLTELVQLRRQCEEATSQRKWMDAERDAAQLELSRKALALGQAEEEVRRLKHQNEQLERLAALKHDAGTELTKTVAENSAIATELAQTREQLAAVQKQLGVGHQGVSLLVSELGAKVYALRAAIARISGSFADQATGSTIQDTLDQILAHLNDGNSHVHALRELAEKARPDARSESAALPS